ncbi:unnamed protein product [Adineta steineri]|uniref:Uncharacterized protein n=1 Tax=Adineta steineri TaxID=433720 RepID=A0A815M502_9BILA|nr:unnamed protein product [Adineta steineri]CAF1413117.1 unnamed protein product [Adineta steineri]
MSLNTSSAFAKELATNEQTISKNVLVTSFTPKEEEFYQLSPTFLYGFNLFINKTYQLSHWSLSLTSSYSLLSHEDRKKMIRYATHDVMAVTFLIRPITEKWTFKKIKNRMNNEIFIIFNSNTFLSLPTATSSKKIKSIIV